MQLVPNWRQAWRMASVRLMGAAIAFPVVWDAIPDETKGSIPPSVTHWITAALLLAGILGRVVKQEKVSGCEPANPASPA